MSKTKALALSIATLVMLVAAGLFLQSIGQKNQTMANFAFEFDSSNFEDWWSAGNSNARSSAESAGYDEANYGPVSELPTANISVHHGKPEENQPDDRCFFSFAYYDQDLESLEWAYDNYESKFSEGASLELINSEQNTLSTPEGVKTYDLRSYHAEVDAPGEYLSGTQVGFVMLDKGHIEVRGNCQTPGDTNLTPPVMQAVSLRKS